MSTNTTLGEGEGFHLYQDMFQDDRVYLELDNVEFEARPDQITVSIPLEIWELIRQCKAADTSFGERTDEELENMAKDLLAKHEAVKNGTSIRIFVDPMTEGFDEFEVSERKAEVLRRLWKKRDKSRAFQQKIEEFARELKGNEEHDD